MAFRKRRTTRKRVARRKYLRKLKKYYRRSIGAQPAQKIMRMRYNECLSLDPAMTGALATYIFNGSSINDPNYTGTGHQPRTHDQWALFYDQYCVLGSKITVVFQTTDQAASAPCTIGISRKDTVTTLSSANEYKENRDCVWTKLGNQLGGDGIKKLTLKTNSKKFLGRKTMDDDTVMALFGSDPADGVFYHIFIQGESDTANIGNIYLDVTIEYIVSLRQPKKLAQS